MKKRRIGIRIENNKVYMGSNYHVGVACIGELCKWKDLDVGDYFQPIRSRNKKAHDGVSEKRVNKDGTVWEKELVELFYFNLEGKISGVEQFQRDIE